ncbi:hypothetical protein L6V77_21545 [Myxococcota bacterium]|nr:hypothetical protein [Myxococcota bacterium]
MQRNVMDLKPPTRVTLGSALLLCLVTLSACGGDSTASGAKTPDAEAAGGEPGGSGGEGGTPAGGEAPPPRGDAGPEGDALTCIVGSIGCECTAGGGCEPGLACNADHKCDVPPPAECPVGTLDCPCDKGACASPDLACNAEGFCEARACLRGTEGCPCTAAGRCGVAEDGSALVCVEGACQAPGCTAGALGCMCDAGVCQADAECVDGVCRPNDCPAGETGCPCGAGGACDAAGDTCDAGTCQPEGCTAGTLGCACVARGCNGGLECAGDVCIEQRGGVGEACLAGDRCSEVHLECLGGTCVDRTGSLNFRCGPDGACDGGLSCQFAFCRQCVLGEEGCNCDDGDCDRGLVCNAQTDRCVEEVRDPDDLVCYTACTGRYYFPNGNGPRTACPPDGLVRDCHANAAHTCREGSCLLPDAPVPRCESDAQCPDFQTCVDAKCISTCERDADCDGDDEICHRKVCRQTCSLSDGACAVGYTCNAQGDGTTGVCLFSVPATAEPRLQVDGAVQLTTPALSFSTYDTDRTFGLTNDSDEARRFVIRKVAHTITNEDGTTEERTEPDAELRCDLPCEERERIVRERCEAEGRSDAVCNQRVAADRPFCNPAVSCPLTWLDLYVDGRPAQRAQEIEVQVPANTTAIIHVANAAGAPGVAYSGRIEVRHPQVNTTGLDLAYTQSATGQWTGRMYYFSQFGTTGLYNTPSGCQAGTPGCTTGWVNLPNAAPGSPQQAGTRDAPDARQRLGNAFLEVWGAFRAERLSFTNFIAMLTSVRTGSWAFERVARDCVSTLGNGRRNIACYLSETGFNGLVELSANTQNDPVPSGVVELPISMNLQERDGNLLAGRINSAEALHYAGDPGIEIRLASPPGTCTRSPSGACLLLVDPGHAMTPAAYINVGGRIELDDPDDACPAGFNREVFPWLPVGFLRQTGFADDLGVYRAECRSTQLPFAEPALGARNRHLAASNPIPDGRPRRRELRILDGGFLNQEQLFLIFEERFESFLGASDTSGFSSYGYMLMTRSGQDLDVDVDQGPGAPNGIPDVFEGARPPAQVAVVDDELAPTCTEALVDLIPGLTPRAGGAVADGNAAVETLVHGVSRSAGALACLQVLDPDGHDQPCLAPGQTVHFYCEETGTFDGGNGEIAEACPAGSRVTYFLMDAGAPDPAAHRCNTHAAGERGTCQTALNAYVDAGWVAELDPAWTCRRADQALCSEDRLDLLAGKVFFPPLPEPVAVFRPLSEAIDQAFRYKTRFRSRTGATVGFAPQICLPDSDQIPYCYDPDAIEGLRERVDCLISVRRSPTQFAALSDSNKQLLVDTLKEAFAVGPVDHPPNAPRSALRDGFERLYAELLVMMGDEALTRAFASRYDIAGDRGGAFDGTAFEPNGIVLSGVVGGEFRSLYEARQYYQEAVTRLFSLAPTLWGSIRGEREADFVTAATVGEYFERVIRASTQKTRAASAIAERYQRVNRPDLARGVLEREYTAAYIESVILSRMLQGIIDQADQSARDGVRLTMEDAARRYRAALMEMQNAYRTIADDVNIFGFAPDYIPFPTIDVRETNGFENMLLRVEQRLRLAREKEDAAISGDRAFETDTAEFQSELVRLRNTYEGQLREICGSFEGPDGVIYPAIKKYASLSPVLERLGDPCGLVTNGDIHSALITLEQGHIDVNDRLQAIRDVFSRIENATTYLNAMCDLQEAFIDMSYDIGGERRELREDIHGLQLDIQLMESAQALAQQEVGAALSCAGGLAAGPAAAAVCGASGAAGKAYALVHIGLEVGVQIQQRKINHKELELLDLDIEQSTWPYLMTCRASTLEVQRQIQDLVIELKRKELDALRAQYQLALQRGEMQRLFNRAQRLQAEGEEAQQLAINVAAARNDPNIRIFRNDAVINAEVAFDAAIREAYRATLVFEYYTSQSYARRGDLFLTRLVSRGQYTLENYMNDLGNAFFEFEEEFGLPNLRVQVISMRDDMFAIPRTAPDGRAYTLGERIGFMREKLLNPAILDRRGYTSIPFGTSLDRLSPATRNHKIRYIEAEINADSAGDAVARLYLTQGGTSLVNSVRDEKLYYRFPELSAVLNPFIGGNKVFDPEVYQNARLRDRPLVATDWRLLINQRDERVNQDLDLASVNDIRLFVYYTDFTEL